jgi:hypothetical protein
MHCLNYACGLTSGCVCRCQNCKPKVCHKCGYCEECGRDNSWSLNPYLNPYWSLNPYWMQPFWTQLPYSPGITWTTNSEFVMPTITNTHLTSNDLTFLTVN